MFHFLVSPECDIDYLQGSAGGYVSAIAVAESREYFISAVFQALRDRQLHPDDEYQEVENISEQYKDSALSEEWMELGKNATEELVVQFGTFDLYAQHE